MRIMSCRAPGHAIGWSVSHHPRLVWQILKPAGAARLAERPNCRPSEWRWHASPLAEKSAHTVHGSDRNFPTERKDHNMTWVAE
jgi:hypothetical protein